MSRYFLPVRAKESPHEVIGRVAVPYAAAVGAAQWVRLPFGEPGGDPASIGAIDLEVKSFVIPGNQARELAISIERARWPEILRGMQEAENRGF